MAEPSFLGLFPPQAFNDPAPAGAIQEAERTIGRTLPKDYCAFLAVSDGYDDAVGEAHLSLWPAGQIALRNDMFEVSRQIADVVLIGSNGGGTVYGIDWAGGAPKFVCVPFASMQRAGVRELAATFEDFLQLVAKGQAQ